MKPKGHFQRRLTQTATLGEGEQVPTKICMRAITSTRLVWSLSGFTMHQLYRRWRCYYYAKGGRFLYESCEFYGTLWPNFRKNWPIRFFKGSLPTTNGKLFVFLVYRIHIAWPNNFIHLDFMDKQYQYLRSRIIIKLLSRQYCLQLPVICQL